MTARDLNEGYISKCVLWTFSDYSLCEAKNMFQLYNDTELFKHYKMIDASIYGSFDKNTFFADSPIFNNKLLSQKAQVKTSQSGQLGG